MLVYAMFFSRVHTVSSSFISIFVHLPISKFMSQQDQLSKLTVWEEKGAAVEKVTSPLMWKHVWVCAQICREDEFSF